MPPIGSGIQVVCAAGRARQKRGSGVAGGRGAAVTGVPRTWNRAVSRRPLPSC